MVLRNNRKMVDQISFLEFSILPHLWIKRHRLLVVFYEAVSYMIDYYYLYSQVKSSLELYSILDGSFFQFDCHALYCDVKRFGGYIFVSSKDSGFAIIPYIINCVFTLMCIL